MAGFGMIAPGVTVDNFGSGTPTGFGGFLGRWGDAYRKGMKIGQEQGTLNSQYSLDQTKKNTEINDARQDDHLRQIEFAAMAGDATALQMLNAYKARQANKTAAAAVGVSGRANGIGTSRLPSTLWGTASGGQSIGVTPTTGDLSPDLTNWRDDNDTYNINGLD